MELPSSKKINSKLKDLSNFSFNHFQNIEHVGVLAGKSGIALFHYYLYLKTKNEVYRQRGMEILKYSIEQVNDKYFNPSFCEGIAGLTWVLSKLKSHKLIDIDDDLILTELDSFLFSSMERFILKKNYAFLHGASGISFYFLKRFTTTKSLKKRYRGYLSLFVKNILNSLKECENSIPRFLNKIFNTKNNRKIDLGISHGVSGLLNILNRINLYLPSEELSELIKRITYFLVDISRQPDGVNFFSCFPNHFFPEIKTYNSRLAWCYGDLSIGITLLQILSQKSPKLDYIFNSTIKRKASFETLIEDPFICHGTTGLTQVYYRLNKLTPNRKYLKMREYWFVETFKQIEKGVFWSDLGFTSERINLLEGFSGLGLALLTLNTPNDELYSWDECLLLS